MIEAPQPGRLWRCADHVALHRRLAIDDMEKPPHFICAAAQDFGYAQLPRLSCTPRLHSLSANTIAKLSLPFDDKYAGTILCHTERERCSANAPACNDQVISHDHPTIVRSKVLNSGPCDDSTARGRVAPPPR